MDKSIHHTLYWACDYLSMLGLKLIHAPENQHNGFRWTSSGHCLLACRPCNHGCIIMHHFIYIRLNAFVLCTCSNHTTMQHALPLYIMNVMLRTISSEWDTVYSMSIQWNPRVAICMVLIFVVTGVTVCCHNDNLWCHQWRRSPSRVLMPLNRLVHFLTTIFQTIRSSSFLGCHVIVLFHNDFLLAVRSPNQLVVL